LMQPCKGGGSERLGSLNLLRTYCQQPDFVLGVLTLSVTYATLFATT
jgi:hypothetical protein